MAQQPIDKSGNEPLGVVFGKIDDNFTELYSADASNTNWSGTTVTATGLVTAGSAKIDTGTKTATATGGAATLNKRSGVITSESLTTAAGASYTLTLTNSTIAATSQVVASVGYGTANAGTPCVTRVTPGSGTLTIVIQNVHASAALNGTINITFISLTA